MSFTLAQPPSERPVRILIENGTYGLRNLGDILMLQALADRIRAVSPDANLRVVTDSPERLRFFLPTAHPVRPGDWNRTFERRRFVRSIKRSVNSFSHQMIRRMRDVAPGRSVEPDDLSRVLSHYGTHTPSTLRFFRELVAADAVVCSGGGYFTDHFLSHAMGLLQTLECAQQLRKPTALFGQGIGPIENPTFLALAAKVFPKVNLLAVRDERSSGPFLRHLGVPDNRIVFTGDDALDAAAGFKPRTPGKAIGFNLRLASYSGVDATVAATIASEVRALAESLEAPIVPLPISISPTDGDLIHYRRALALSAADVPDISPLTLPSHTMELVAKCRLVITGSYHAAVFAMAMGIPAIGIAATPYYHDKLQGLADQFPTLMRVVQLDSVLVSSQLREIAMAQLSKPQKPSIPPVPPPVPGRKVVSQFLRNSMDTSFSTPASRL